MAETLRKKKSRFTRYPANRSPLYRLRRKRLLAELLQVDLKHLNRLLKQGDNYRFGSTPKKDGGVRPVEDPKRELKAIHTRLLKLLARIETPAYLHSGVKGKSYLSNAEKHIGARGLAKLDIRKFFPSTTFSHVRRGLIRTFQCSVDVAHLIANICTVEGHLPTGSPISCLVAYYAHKDMFDAVFRLAEENCWTFTCYVDDITISGPGVNRRSLHKLKQIVEDQGLQSHPAKERVYTASQVKRVTGVIVDAERASLPNDRRKAIYDGLNRLKVELDPVARAALAKELLGRSNEAAHVDSQFRARLPWLKTKITEYSRLV